MKEAAGLRTGKKGVRAPVAAPVFSALVVRVCLLCYTSKGVEVGPELPRPEVHPFTLSVDDMTGRAARKNPQSQMMLKRFMVLRSNL